MNFSHARFFPIMAFTTLTALNSAAFGASFSTSHAQEFRQNFNFSNTDLRSAFKALSATGRVDIVVSPTVNGTVPSLQLTDKTWQEALIILCQMFNLKYTVEKDYLYVQPISEFNKSSVENATAMQQTGALAPLVRDVIHLRNAKGSDLLESVKGLLSVRGRVNYVERNNAFLVFDTRQNIREIRAAIDELDVPTPEVNIQAQLIEVDADGLQSMGVDWQFGQGHVGALLNTPGKIDPSLKGNFNAVGTSNPGGITANSQSSTSGGTASSTTTSSGVGGVTGATSQFAFGLLNTHLAVAVADLLSESRGEILAKPQITTVDNTEARIFMGEEVPVKVLDVNGRQAIQLEDAGTSLTVTPHVTGDGHILLDLEPEKNSYRVDAQAGVILEKENAKTTVLVNDGETVVIAGLTTKEETDVETGIPLLKDIPILGWLFKHKSHQTTKRDLIVFVTPHIVSNGEVSTTASATSANTDRNDPGVYGNAAPEAGETGAAPGANPAAAAATPAATPATATPVQTDDGTANPLRPPTMEH